MITFEDVSVHYQGVPGPVLSHASFTVEEGELCVVTGRTGSGKSTLLGAVNGHVPRFTGANLHGRVTVAGRDTSTHHPRDLADVVGVVGQDPLAGFVTDTVEEELAYGPEQLGVDPAVMRTRVEDTLDLLGIADIRNRSLRTLSGGQQQRVAIGSVLTAQARVLVLDEPTSSLDPTAAEEVLAAITRLVHDLGLTVVMAEHRLERVVQYADRLIHVSSAGVSHGSADEVLASSDLAPPVVVLGRLARWSPLPRSVRDARRLATPLRDRLEGLQPPERGHDLPDDGRERTDPRTPLNVKALVVRYGALVANREVTFDLPAGQVTALMGRNGSGKSTLLWAVQGSLERTSGTVDVEGADPANLPPPDRRKLVGLVPQTPGDLLYLSTVDDECAQADRDAHRPEGTCRDLCRRMVPGVVGTTHPRDLSEGQRLGLVLAIQLTAAPRVVLLDEPTRGLDYHAKESLVEVLHELAAEGRAILLASHDVEFVATVADRVMVMAEGEVVATGPMREVLIGSSSLTPQVARVLAPLKLVNVSEVAALMGPGR